MDKFKSIFNGLERAYGQYKAGDVRENGKQGGKAFIKKEKVTDQLWQDHLDGKDPSLGIIPIRDNANCSWCCIDVDTYPLDYKKLLANIKKRNFPIITCRSKSGGAHLFIFIDGEIPARLARSKLSEISAALGYASCEIFPKQIEIKAERGDTGNFLNLPYHGGDKSNRYAFHPDTANALTLEEFYKLYDEYKVTPEKFKDIKVKKKKEKNGFSDGPCCIETLVELGIPEGGRDNALYQYAIYAKKKYPGQWKEKVDEFNFKYMKPPLSSQQVQKTITQHEKNDYQYKCKDTPMCNHCNSSLCKTRKYGIGNDYEHNFSDLTKYQSDESIWFLNIDGRRISLTTEQLFDQNKFRKACMDNLNVLPNPMNNRDWTVRVQSLLENVEVIEMPEEVTREGRFSDLLDSFMNEQAEGLNIDEILIGKPFTEDNKTYFKMSALEEYLRKKKFNDFTTTQMAARIRQLGGGDTRKKVRGKTVYVWWLPADDREVLEGSLATPEVSEEIPF